MRQRTINNPISLQGVTLHAGASVIVTLRPAPEDTGIVFRRVDLGGTEIRAVAAHVSQTMLCTTVTENTASVATIEHLMAALAGLGIDNVYADINGPEVPIMDGSAGHFVFLIQSAGVKRQQALKRFIRIKKPIKVEDGDKYVMLEPYDGFKIDFTLDFQHPALTECNCNTSFKFSSTAFIKEISRARTFGFMAQIEKLRQQNLILGGSLDNAIVLDAAGVVNTEGLRYPDELIKHKILDAIGDLYLLGSSIIGAFTGYKSGHALNNALARALLSPENTSCWEMVTFDDNELAPISYFKSALIVPEAA